MRQTVFNHSGDLGDIIYALPAIRAAGGGILNLIQNAPVREPMTVQKAKLIKEFLETQSYIKSVTYMESYNGGAYNVYDLDQFRDYLRRDVSLAEAHCKLLQVKTDCLKKPWLECKINPIASTVMARSERYHNPNFPWEFYARQYRNSAAFVGTKPEYVRFHQLTGLPKYVVTKTLVDLAEVINGCGQFMGNQSAPLAIAIGLGKNCIIEEYKQAPNCRFRAYRDNVRYV